MEQEKEIIIVGDKFIATRLIPNYKGEYDCRCEECHFHLDWTSFGQYKHCQKVMKREITQKEKQKNGRCNNAGYR